MRPLTIVGAGLAGTEAAWQAVKRGVPVELWEMRPQKMTPAHQTGLFAELVCSNSLKATSLENASGLLKEEMNLLDSLIIKTAYAHRVPAGGALAVDREGFAAEITDFLTNHPLINLRHQELQKIPNGRPLIIATGPLTEGPLAREILRLTGENYFSFYDAAAPIVTAASIDRNKVFLASRYGKGEAAYLNCPLDEQEYQIFYHALLEAQQYPLKDFDQQAYFEGCMPVEALARRGNKTLLFGPLKPKGLIDPRTGKEPYAVVQLRQDDKDGTLYNLVGFQTNLKWSEQKRVFSLIPGLEQAEFVRYGVMHRNSFINAPKLLMPTGQLKGIDGLYFAGQLTGVEGYVESAASGLVAGLNATRFLQARPELVFPCETALGSLLNYIVTASAKHFQPMNINFGLFPPLSVRVKGKKERNQQISERSLANLKNFIKINDI